jgi:hypothetical protein
MEPVLADRFYHDGRGPALVRVHYSKTGSTIEAADYQNPDESKMRHLVFRASQVFMFTPEEVENYEADGVAWARTNRAAIVSLGRSPWLRSFAQTHLGRCNHYRVMFYDEYLDIVCEGIEANDGAYVAA